MKLHPEIEKAFRGIYDKLSSEGKLLSKEKLAACYKNFREKFGPEVLQSLDGEALLDYMHSHATKDSLVYWLEFKDDEELPAIFGSIAGGSALKFGIYKRKETGAWMTGHPSNQQELTVDEAITVARKHRDQLAKGDELLSRMPSDPSYEEYVKLQDSLDKEAPDVSKLAWGHKYLHLLHPEILDDFHSPIYQRFMLIKMLQAPPSQEGRYLAAYSFQKIAQTFGIHINHLTYSLNELYGSPYSYWRIGTTDGDDSTNYWPEMQKGKFISVGWSGLGDLSWVSCKAEDKEKLKESMAEKYPKPAHVISRQTNQLFKFLCEVKEGELVVAANGMTILGIAKVTGDYFYDAQAGFPHKRQVNWLSLESWQEPVQEGLRTTVHKLGKYPENLLEIERRILDAPTDDTIKLSGIPGQIQSVLERKKQVILYGPPGTGKTHWAEVAIKDLAALSWYGKSFGDLNDEQKSHLQPGNREDNPVRMCCFHPAYGYEDFLEGYRPELHDNKMAFVTKKGIFKQLCEDAQKRPDKNFYLLIDEINRGDIPRIFGELLTILEKNKRGKSITLPLSVQPFLVPENVYIVGTMNTADRSIALLDAALRRRFGFIELMPDSAVLGGTMVEGLPLGAWLDSLNRRICEHVGRDARNLQIGHSYLMDGSKPLRSFSGLARALQEDIIPLLEEYCYEDYTALSDILSKKLIDVEAQQIRKDMFNPAKKDDLVRVLLEMDPDIAFSDKAVKAEQEALEIQGDGNDGKEDDQV